MAAAGQGQRCLVYGATGFTGRLIARAAMDLGLAPILAGRNDSKLKLLARSLGLESRVFPLDDHSALDKALADVTCVIHAAGPFDATSRPMVDGCLRTGTHYLDITGEIEVLEKCAKRDSEAKAQGIMLLPGAGFDVVPTDCLAKHVANHLPGAMHLILAIRAGETVSRGTTKTAIKQAGLGINVRRGGRIVRMTTTPKREVDFGDGPKPAYGASWGDISTAYHSTGIPDIDVFFCTTPQIEQFLKLSERMGRVLQYRPVQWLMERAIDRQPEGPTEVQRKTVTATILATAIDGKRRQLTARLDTPEPYALTAQLAASIADRVLDGDIRPGFQTPSLLLGSDFILGFEGVSRQDLPDV